LGHLSSFQLILLPEVALQPELAGKTIVIFHLKNQKLTLVVDLSVIHLQLFLELQKLRWLLQDFPLVTSDQRIVLGEIKKAREL